MIQFVTEPEVYIVSRLATDRKALRRFFQDRGFSGQVTAPDNAPPAEVPITVGSRTCYQSFDAGREHAAHVKHLVDVGHGSCLEHAVYGVLLAGISRSCGRELLRHRHLSPSEMSQRYCDMSSTRFVIPPADLPDYWAWASQTPDTTDTDHLDAANRFMGYVDLCVHSLNCYRERVENSGRKTMREAARSRLLECVETRILFTGNLRAYRNLFEKRCSIHADAEIRRVCCKLFDLMSAECPNVFADYTRDALADGTFSVSTPQRSI